MRSRTLAFAIPVQMSCCALLTVPVNAMMRCDRRRCASSASFRGADCDAGVAAWDARDGRLDALVRVCGSAPLRPPTGASPVPILIACGIRCVRDGVCALTCHMPMGVFVHDLRYSMACVL